jgi:phosphohistidine phosphatase
VKLYLVRHATAQPFGPGGSDHDRALTPEGRARFAQTVTALAGMGVSFERLLASPLVRARETAELMVPALAPSFATTDLLAREPGHDLVRLLRDETTALVGHQPWMSELLEMLTAGSSRAASAVHFGTGTVASLEGEPRPGGMRLHALWPAETLARLAAT